MVKKRRRYYDSYTSIKGKQWKTRKLRQVVRSDEVEDMVVNGLSSRVNKRRNGRVGHVEKANET